MDNISTTTKRGKGRPRLITALDVDCLRDHVYLSRTLQDVATEYGNSREAIRQHVAKFPDSIRRDKRRAGHFLTWYANQKDYSIPYGDMLEWVVLRDTAERVPAPAPEGEADSGA